MSDNGNAKSLDWGWKTELLLWVVGDVSTVAALGLVAALIVRDAFRIARNSSAGVGRVV